MKHTDRVQNFKFCLHHLMLCSAFCAVEVVHGIRTSNGSMAIIRRCELVPPEHWEVNGRPDTTHARCNTPTATENEFQVQASAFLTHRLPLFRGM
jgi:hypothetical protein